MRPVFKVGFFTRRYGSAIDPGAFASFQILSPQPGKKKNPNKNKVCLIGRCCAATERLSKEAILGQNEPELDQKGALPAPKGLMQLEVSG